MLSKDTKLSWDTANVDQDVYREMLITMTEITMTSLREEQEHIIALGNKTDINKRCNPAEVLTAARSAEYSTRTRECIAKKL